MKRPLSIALVLLCFCACSGKEDHATEEEQAVIASETGIPLPLPPDIIYTVRPLIHGKLYSEPDFEAVPVAYFDTTQQIYVLDTSNTMFAKARIRQDTAQYTGYVPKTILPARAQE